MHEASIVTGLMGILTRQAQEHHVDRVVKVTLRVGRLRAVEPKQLIACFEMFAEGTIADGAELVIEEVGVRARCKGCGTEFEVPRYQFECPNCGGGDVDVLTGQELHIKSFDAAAKDSSGG